MFIRFKAESYELNGIKLVNVYDYETGHTITLKLKTYHRISKFLAYNGGIIFRERKTNE